MTKDWWCWYSTTLRTTNTDHQPSSALARLNEQTPGIVWYICDYRRRCEAPPTRLLLSLPLHQPSCCSSSSLPPPASELLRWRVINPHRHKRGMWGVHRVGGVVVVMVVEGLARQDATQTWRRFLLMHRKLFPPHRQCLPGVRRC